MLSLVSFQRQRFVSDEMVSIRYPLLFCQMRPRCKLMGSLYALNNGCKLSHLVLFQMHIPEQRDKCNSSSGYQHGSDKVSNADANLWRNNCNFCSSFPAATSLSTSRLPLTVLYLLLL